MNEQALIQDVKANGSEDSFKELTELHKERLLAFIRKFTHSNPIDQMDVYNKTLLRVWDNIGQYQEDKCFKWWLFQIAKNVFFNEYKKLKKQVREELPIEDVVQSSEFIENRTPASEIMDREKLLAAMEKVQSLKKTLSKKHIEVFELIFEQGKSYSEASKLLNCSRGTIMSRVFYTRKKLQETFKKYEYSDSH